MNHCKGCDCPLPPSKGPRPRVWCSDPCRKRAKPRTKTMTSTATKAMPSPSVAEALRSVLDELADVDAWDATRGAIAIAMANVVDAGGAAAVPAARELRALLLDMAAIADDDMRRFLASVQTPLVGKPRESAS